MIFLPAKHHPFPSCCVLAVIAIGLPAFAQVSPEASPSLPQQIILPQKVVSGAPATLAVVDASGQLVPKVLVEISNGQKIITDATGRGAFNAPKNAGMMTAQITAQGITAFAFVLAPPATQPANVTAGNEAARILSYSRFVTKTDKFTIDGTGFRGDADTNQVTLSGQQCFVLAASPVSLVVFPGAQTPIGEGNLSAAVAGKSSASIAINVVDLEPGASEETTHVGAKGIFSVRVRGASEPLSVEIVNKSPDVVQLQQGAAQQLKTSGGGNNTAQVTIKSLKPGDYEVTAHLVTTVSGQIDLESSRQELLAARLASTGKWPRRVDNVLKRFDKKTPNIGKIRLDLALMLRDMPPGQLAWLLDAALQDLIRN